MKQLIMMITVLLATTMAYAQNEATYYRFWQGFKLPDLTSEQFVQGLPPFMQSTVDVYQGKGINNYLVALPPANKPAFIPDEFALVAFDNEADYLADRNTPAGKAYANSHWQHFDQ